VKKKKLRTSYLKEPTYVDHLIFTILHLSCIVIHMHSFKEKIIYCIFMHSHALQKIYLLHTHASSCILIHLHPKNIPFFFLHLYPNSDFILWVQRWWCTLIIQLSSIYLQRRMLNQDLSDGYCYFKSLI
jgi:hypothetical protein